jgi:hypothetical protein
VPARCQQPDAVHGSRRSDLGDHSALRGRPKATTRHCEVLQCRPWQTPRCTNLGVFAQLRSPATVRCRLGLRLQRQCAQVGAHLHARTHTHTHTVAAGTCWGGGAQPAARGPRACPSPCGPCAHALHMQAAGTTPG